MKKLLSISALFFALPLVACGDDKGSTYTPPPPFDSGEEDAAVASALSAEDRAAICNDALAYMNAHISSAQYKRLTCTLLGLTFGQAGGMSCGEFVTQCMSSDETGEFDEYTCDADKLANCTATVAEIEACYTATVAVTGQLANTLSCSSSAADLEGQFGEEPAACTAVKQKCPDLFDDEDDTSGDF